MVQFFGLGVNREVDYTLFMPYNRCILISVAQRYVLDRRPSFLDEGLWD